jgi:hypothetical protein
MPLPRIRVSMIRFIRASYLPRNIIISPFETESGLDQGWTRLDNARVREKQLDGNGRDTAVID